MLTVVYTSHDVLTVVYISHNVPDSSLYITRRADSSLYITQRADSNLYITRRADSSLYITRRADSSLYISRHADSSNNYHLQSTENAISYFRIPETPRDTAETNPILRYEKLPEFSKLTPENIIKGGAKLAIEFETKLAAHSEQLSGR
jgi:hypothetical protein